MQSRSNNMDKNNAKKTSPIPYQIISILNKKSDIRFKEIKEMLDVSGQTLSIHLKELLKENTIEFEKKGREKHYKLNKKSALNIRRKIEIFSSNHINQIESLVKTGDYEKDMSNYEDDYEDHSPQEYYNNLVNAIGTYFLFTLFKGFEKGENWFDGFSKNGIALYILDSFCLTSFKNFNSSDLAFYLANNDFDKFFKEANSMLDKKSKEDIKTVFGNLEQLYESHFIALKESLKSDYKYRVHL